MAHSLRALRTLTRNARESRARRTTNLPVAANIASGAEVTSESMSTGTASFDVIEKTKEFIAKGAGYYSFPDESLYDNDFVFKAKIVGPLNKKDYIYTMKMLKPHTAMESLEPNAFGFSVDPENPLRVFFFLRVTGKHTKPWTYAGAGFAEPIDSTNVEAKLPPEVGVAEFTPEGKCKFYSVGNVVYPFEGNSGGLGAIFGLFVSIGRADVVKPAADNDNIRAFFDWFAHTVPGSFGYLRTNSEEIPRWFKNLQEKHSLK